MNKRDLIEIGPLEAWSTISFDEVQANAKAALWKRYAEALEEFYYAQTKTGRPAQKRFYGEAQDCGSQARKAQRRKELQDTIIQMREILDR